MDVCLPADLLLALERRLEGASRNELAGRAARISEMYRRSEPTRRSVLSEADAIAYALSRLPATYAACVTVFARLAAEHPEFQPESLIDIGAGPGTAAWAACELWPSLAAVTLVDRSQELLGLARSLSAASGHAAMRQAKFELADISSLKPNAASDLVVASYALTELPDVEAVSAVWLRFAGTALVLIEPGRPRDYERLMRVRRRLASDANVVAPCPHAEDCPLPPGDWCHFSTRLPRTRDHLRVKGASVPFEDEKFSYLALSPKESSLRPRPSPRVLARPEVSKHDVTLKLCAPDGLQFRTIASRDKSAFKAAKKLAWGDVPPDFS